MKMARNLTTMYYMFSLVLVAVAASLIDSSAAVDLNIEVEPRTITVGDPVEILLTVTAPTGERVLWPAPDQFSPAEVLTVDTLKSRRGTHSIRYLVSLFEPGDQQLPDLPIGIERPDEIDTVWVTVGTVTVESIIAPGDSLAEIRDIHPPVKLAWTFHDLLPYIIGFVVLVIAGVLAYILWRRYQKKQGLLPEFQPPPILPHELALRRLDDLRIRRVWQDGYVKKYYSELNEIIKEYIGGRFEINALEMTTTELLDRRRSWDVADEPYRLTSRILTTGDLVKFARFKPDPHQNDKDLDSGYEIVNSTKERISFVDSTELPEDAGLQVQPTAAEAPQPGVVQE